MSRVLMSKFACLMARGLTPVRDATSGFFLMRRDRARGVTISAGGFKICLELLIRSEPKLVIEVLRPKDVQIVRSLREFLVVPSSD